MKMDRAISTTTIINNNNNITSRRSSNIMMLKEVNDGVCYERKKTLPLVLLFPHLLQVTSCIIMNVKMNILVV